MIFGDRTEADNGFKKTLNNNICKILRSSRLDLSGCTAKISSLTADCEALENRLNKDIEFGTRNHDVIQRSISKMKKYDYLNTEKIDVSKISAKQAAEIVSAIILE